MNRETKNIIIGALNHPIDGYLMKCTEEKLKETLTYQQGLAFPGQEITNFKMDFKLFKSIADWNIWMPLDGHPYDKVHVPHYRAMLLGGPNDGDNAYVSSEQIRLVLKTEKGAEYKLAIRLRHWCFYTLDGLNP